MSENQQPDHEMNVDNSAVQEALDQNVVSGNSTGHVIKRLGCIFALVIWFSILLLPCFFIVLATQQEIIVSQGRLPGQDLRIWLIMEANQRGLAFSSTSTYPAQGVEAQEGICLQTNVSYFLWQGTGENSAYCDCYANSGTNETPSWTLLTTEGNACQ